VTVVTETEAVHQRQRKVVRVWSRP
jgi:hypothetical protein